MLALAAMRESSSPRPCNACVSYQLAEQEEARRRAEEELSALRVEHTHTLEDVQDRFRLMSSEAVRDFFTACQLLPP